MKTFIVTVEATNNINTAVIVQAENRNEAIKKALNKFEGAVSVQVYDVIVDLREQKPSTNRKSKSEEVCLSIEALYQAFGEDLSFMIIKAMHCTVSGKSCKFDIFNKDGGLVCRVCRNVESATIISYEGDIYTLESEGIQFKLNKKEFDIATQG